MLIETSDKNKIKELIKKIKIPAKNSHKGDNGKVLIIGGSSLFHSASLWSAEVASYFVDIVHYSSTEENQKIFIKLKSKFRNGIVVPKEKIVDYVKEDDSILIGPGMLRDKRIKKAFLDRKKKLEIKDFNEILSLKEEAVYTYQLTAYLMENFSHKKFIFDAGSLQMMNLDWFYKLKEIPIITPHQGEFKLLFGINLQNLTLEDKIKIVEQVAKKFRLIILLKAIDDIVSNGNKTMVIRGGNQGLTKGGTGDLLAGLTLAFSAKNDSFLSAVCSSIILKKSADFLYNDFRYWYNIDNLLLTIPKVFNQLYLN